MSPADAASELIRRCRKGELRGDRGRHDADRARAEGDVGPPLPRRSDSLRGPDDLSPRDDEPQVIAERPNQLLDERAGLAEPRPEREHLERALELAAVVAEQHVATPTAEARA